MIFVADTSFPFTFHLYCQFFIHTLLVVLRLWLVASGAFHSIFVWFESVRAFVLLLAGLIILRVANKSSVVNLTEHLFFTERLAFRECTAAG